MAGGGRWQDLSSRLVSGAAMALVGVVIIALGGLAFRVLAATVAAVIVWELARMLAPAARGIAAIAAALALAIIVALRLLPGEAIVLVVLPAALGAAGLPAGRLAFAAFALAAVLAAAGLAGFRDDHGMVWLIWLLVVVIATDICGYFAGRAIGGPRFWPAVSPSKTWSGTVAGWLAAAAIGLVFRTFTNAGVDLPWISVALAMSAQAGDLAESALKRRAGVKDSSALLPGHGGLFDRFDGLLGASLFMLVLQFFVAVPEVRL